MLGNGRKMRIFQLKPCARLHKQDFQPFIVNLEQVYPDYRLLSSFKHWQLAVFQPQLISLSTICAHGLSMNLAMRNRKNNILIVLFLWRAFLVTASPSLIVDLMLKQWRLLLRKKGINMLSMDLKCLFLVAVSVLYTLWWQKLHKKRFQLSLYLEMLLDFLSVNNKIKWDGLFSLQSLFLLIMFVFQQEIESEMKVSVLKLQWRPLMVEELISLVVV